MSYNQKVWLGILALCSVFWLAVIESVFSVDQVFERPHQQSPNAFTAHASHCSNATPASDRNLQVHLPVL